MYQTMKYVQKGLGVLLLFAMGLILFSCGDKTVDYTSKLKLTNDFAGKEFVKDGIGQVTLYEKVDGDTAWFLSGNTEVKIRFTSVDTPSSSGQIEAWGKAASNFTGNILDNAETIVLEASDGKKAEVDTTGSRYMAFVWYRMDEQSEFRNLNLELVQNGFSKSKVTEGSKYQDDFNAAATQAMRQKLHVWSSEKDPDYDDSDGVELTIKDVYENAENYLGRRVNFEAVVARVDNNYAYVQNEVDGTAYGMLVYLGYDAMLPYAFRRGYKLRVHGFVQVYNGMYQISGCMYDLFEEGSTSSKYAKYVRVLAKDQEVTPIEVTAETLKEQKIRTLVTIADLEVSSIYTSDDFVVDTIAQQMTITCLSPKGDVQLRTSALYDQGNPVTEEFFRNKSMESVTGIVTTYNGKVQILVVAVGDVVFQ